MDDISHSRLDSVSTASGTIAPTLRQVLVDSFPLRFFYIYAGIICFFGATVAVVTNLYGAGFTASSNLYSPPMHSALKFFVGGFLVWRTCYVMFAIRPARLFYTIWIDLKNSLLSSGRLMSALPVLLLLTMFFSFFTSAKNLITIIQPFNFDPLLSEIDRTIHFGRHPWEWLFPVLGTAKTTSNISLAYKFWFLIKFMVCFWQAFSTSRPQLRAQFFVSFILCWILVGTIMATLLSSAGPCFFASVYPDLHNPYGELMSYLRTSNELFPVHDLFSMDYLWRAYVARENAIFSGISAMPSMHVSITCLFALLAWRVNRILGILFTLYLLVILVGSVFLAWHYAVDGYIAIIVTLAIWWLVGRIFPPDDTQERAAS
ncbi:MAG: phosphatase PAP2 family protein [Pseudomonadales bacterium]